MRLSRRLRGGVAALFWALLGLGLITCGPLRSEERDESSRPEKRPAAARKAPGPVPSDSQIAIWVAALDDARFDVRDEATRRLIEAGAPAVKPVLDAARTGSLETTVRSLAILESLYVLDDAEDEAAVDAAELALETLAEAENRSAATRAAETLERHDDIREARAIAHIQKLGGIVRLDAEGDVRNFVNAGRQGNGRRAIEAVVIPPGWTGGDAGLKYVQRLSQLRSLIRVAGKQVSDKGIRELQAALPDLIVQQRGTASLGIRADQDPQNASNWRVSHVDPNSAAKRGGILPGDVIIRFAGKPVPDFDALVELIKQSQPGEEVEVVVRRGNGEATLQVKMGGWAAP